MPAKLCRDGMMLPLSCFEWTLVAYTATQRSLQLKILHVCTACTLRLGVDEASATTDSSQSALITLERTSQRARFAVGSTCMRAPIGS